MIVPGVNLDEEVIGLGFVSPARPGNTSPILRIAIGSKPAHGGTPQLGGGGGGGGGGNFTSEGGGILQNVNPYFGAAAFFAAGLIKLHPAGRIAGLLIGVGGAVINWGSASAGSGRPDHYNDPSSLYL
jgi:hypothetical protein